MRAFVVGAMAAFQFAAAAAEGEHGSTVAVAKGEECPADTGGHCNIFSCLSFRHANCVNGHCVCPEGSCAILGRCVSTTTTTTTTQPPPPSGVYTIQQVNTTAIGWRYLDAYETADHDYHAVTRLAQTDASQEWILTCTSRNTYTIQQKDTMRYLDAYESARRDYLVVTRSAQSNPSQEWVLTRPYPVAKLFYIQQKDTMRYLDAYGGGSRDYSAFTQNLPVDGTLWQIYATTTSTTTSAPGAYTIQWKGSGGYLDAYESADYDYQAVTRPAQRDASQAWILTWLSGDTCTIQQNSTMRYLDAYEKPYPNDSNAVTRVAEGNPSQEWVLTPFPDEKDTFYIQQKDTRRWLGAHWDGDTRAYVSDDIIEMGGWVDPVWIITPARKITSAAMEMPEIPWKHATDHAMQPGLLALAVITIGLGLVTSKVAKWRSARKNVAQPLLLG